MTVPYQYSRDPNHPPRKYSELTLDELILLSHEIRARSTELTEEVRQLLEQIEQRQLELQEARDKALSNANGTRAN